MCGKDLLSIAKSPLLWHKISLSFWCFEMDGPTALQAELLLNNNRNNYKTWKPLLLVRQPPPPTNPSIAYWQKAKRQTNVFNWEPVCTINKPDFLSPYLPPLHIPHNPKCKCDLVTWRNYSTNHKHTNSILILFQQSPFPLLYKPKRKCCSLQLQIIADITCVSKQNSFF